MAVEQENRPGTNDETPGNAASSPEFGPDELKQIEQSSVGMGGSGGYQTGTSKGKVSYNSGDSKSGGSSPYSTSTSGGAINYDTSNDVPEEESSFYKSSATSPGKVRFFNLLSTRRRKTIFGGGLVGTIVGLFFGFSVVQGPLQLVHFSQILQRSFSRGENTVQIRNKGLFRFARTGNIEETRLGKAGSVVYNRTLSQLRDQGIEFTDRNVRGVPNSMTIDTSKNDAYKDLSPAARENAIIDDFNITDPRIIAEQGHLGSGIFKIDLKNTSLKGIDFVKATTKTAIGSLNNGKIETGLAVRFVKRAWDLPGLFSPYDKFKSSIKNKLSATVERKAAKQAEDDQIAAEEKTVSNSPLAEASKAKLGDALKSRTLIGVLIGQTLLCEIRSAANDAVTVNRAVIVAPAAVQSADKTAKGAQVQSNQNFELAQLDATSSSLTDPKTNTTVWDGRALQALSGISNPGGKDLPVDLAQAFSGKTTADEIRSEIKLQVLGIDLTSAACSKVGLVVGLAGGIAALIAAIPSDGGSEAGYAVWLAFAAKQAINVVAVGGLLYELKTHLTDILQDKAILPSTCSGALGGNVCAYGSRELANIGARSMGGAAIPNTESTTVTFAQQLQDQRDWQAMSPVKRLLDVHDSRSTISKIIDNTNLNPQNLLASTGNLFSSFSNMFSHSILSIFPRALAATSTPYNWGFLQYGIPDTISKNPQYEDPYANADIIAQTLDAACLNSAKAVDSSCSYILNAKACFGVDINKDSEDRWQVVASSDVNPGSDAYPAGTCNDASDTWTRLRLFIYDSRLMDTIACYQGDDQSSCSNIDMGEGAVSSSTTTPTNGSSLPSGTAQQLAQQILANKNIHLIGRLVPDDILAAAAGRASSAGKPLSQTLLSLIAYMGQSHSFNISALESGGTGHSGPGDPHYEGDAVDITGLDGDPIANSGIGRTVHDIALISEIAPKMPTSRGSNLSGFGQINCGTTPSLPNGIVAFDDSCNHLHIQVPVGSP